VEVLEISLPCGVFSLGLTKPMELGPAMKLEYVVDAFVGKSYTCRKQQQQASMA